MKPIRKRSAAVAVAGLLGVGVLVLGVLNLRQASTPEPAPAAISEGIGVAPGAGLAFESAADMNRDLDAIRAAGASWVRIDVDWSSIERNQGQQSWTRIDRAVNAARDHGLEVLGIATYTPRWAQAPGVAVGDTHGRPATPQLFATFAGQAAKHFAGRIGAWEIWNEPNLSAFFAPKVDPTFYTEMLKASYTAVHAVVPDAIVLSAGLAPASDDPGNRTMSPGTFIDRLYTAGGRGSFDAIALHPYSYPELLSVQREEQWAPYAWVRSVRQSMVNNGDEGKKIWFTEFGAPVGMVSWEGRQVSISDEQQAAIVADGLTAARQLPYVGLVFLYNIRDNKTGSKDIEDTFGLLRTDFTPKPSYAVVQRQAALDVSVDGHYGP